MNLLKRLKSKTFSVRSQASYRREAELQMQISPLEEEIHYSQTMINRAQADIEGLSNIVASGEKWAAELIPRNAGQVRNAKDKIAALEPAREKIQAQIDALTSPSPAEAEARAEHQKALAELALERLEVDRALAKTARTLQGILEKRAEMTGRIGELMGKIDFTLAPDRLDNSQFDALRRSLQEDFEGASEEWVDWFLGENQSGRIKMEPHMVQDKVLFIEETLANPGVFRRGDTIDLTPKQLAEIRLKEQTRVGHLVEALPKGGYRSGPRIEIRESRVERIGDAVRSVYQYN